MNKLPIGLQIYSIREEAGADFIKTMQEVKDMGYDGVEFAGLYGHKPEDIRDWLKDIGLIPISAHVPYEAFENDLEGTVLAYAVIGCKYIGIPYLVEDKRYGTDVYDEVLAYLSVIAKECKKHDIVLMYHNHDFEFQKTEDGEYVLDALYKTLSDDELQTEIDTCWVKAAGEDPISYVKKYKNRCPLIHLKDYTGKKPVELTALGQGIQDMEGILSASYESGVKWLIVEQDDHFANSPMEDMKISIEYLRKISE